MALHPKGTQQIELVLGTCWREFYARRREDVFGTPAGVIDSVFLPELLVKETDEQTLQEPDDETAPMKKTV